MKNTRKDEKGSALIIVLAFLFLLTIVTIAFLSRSLLERQLSNASLNQNKIDLVAQSAAAAIIGDLQQEIVAGSSPISATGIYYPLSPTDVIPSLAVPNYTSSTIIGSGMEDLIKVSNHTNGATGNRASAINTTSNASLNFRSISAARWNKALLLAKQSPTTTDRTPVSAFSTPDWIYVARDGSNPGNGGTAVSINSSSPYISLPSVDPSAAINNTQAGHNPITQRYAYTVYDEGSTLDMNVAGSPITGTSGNTITYTPQQPYKNALAYADLTQLLIGFGLSASQEEAFINGIVGWRNNGSGQASGSFPSYTFSVAVPPAAHPFDAFILSTRGGFLSSGGSATQSDNTFTSRQQLLQYLTTPTFLNAAGLTDAQMQTLCPYLGTFTRDIDQPGYVPPVLNGGPKVLPYTNGGNSAYGHDSDVNPSFLSVTVPSNPTFTRNDGSAPVAGEPLVKKRFALNRIAWVTYAGPSASRNLGDLDMTALVNDGIPASFLQEGTGPNIQKYFGLDWDSSNHQWKYDINNGGSGPIQKIAAMTTPHDPDFFELLKSAIAVGSVGKALGTADSAGKANLPNDPGCNQSDQPANVNYYAESSVDYQILQIGANIIDQFQPANYPVQIVFNDSSGNRTIVGVENLPYLSAVLNGVVHAQQSNPLAGVNGAAGSSYSTGQQILQAGVGAWMQLPVIWNPHDPSSPAGPVGPSLFRILADSCTPDLNPVNYRPYVASADGGAPNFSLNASSAPGYQGSFNNPYTFKNTSTGGNTAIVLTLNTPYSATKELCPEPFVVMRTSPSFDSNGNELTPSIPGSLMFSDAALIGTGKLNGSGLSGYPYNAPQMQGSENKDKPSTYYLGFFLGSFPLAWSSSSGGSTPFSAAHSGAFLGLAGANAGTSCYMTYRMQYADPSNPGQWVTYDTKYGKSYNGGDTYRLAVPGTPAVSGALVGASDFGFATDPRSSRFGLMSTAPFDSPYTGHGPGSPYPPFPGPEVSNFWAGESARAQGWLDTANAIVYTMRPDAQSGFACYTGWKTQIGASSGWSAYTGTDIYIGLGLAPGMLSQNNTDAFTTCFSFYKNTQGANTEPPNYFADPDGMVRRAMGGFIAIGSAADQPSAQATVGLPMARVFNWSKSGTSPSSPNPLITAYSPPNQLTSQAQSRPYFLHRPFKSVAELGYVFSDTPWRNLDFFTAESGDTALLDTFCINDTTDPSGLVAGKVNLNTRQAPVLQAIIAAGYLDPALQAALPGNTLATGAIDSATSALVAKALIARTTDTSNIANGTGPLGNVSELVGKWQQNIAIRPVTVGGTPKPPLSAPFYDGKLSYSGFGGGVWDTSNHKPLANGVENFTSGTSQSTGTAEDVYSAFFNSASFTANNTTHNGTQETATYIQRFREAPIRALAAAGTTRVWNLMIDAIAQAGRFPSSATGLDQFNVEGERRYWVHVAIDRLTGKVLDEQIEEVKE